MFWQGYVIKVDAGLEPLLILFNSIPGLATIASCVGDQENLGYVSFAGDSCRAVKAWVRRLKESGGAFLREADYRQDLGYGCIRFERAQLDTVCRLVSELTAGVE